MIPQTHPATPAFAPTFIPAQRINRSLTASAETRTLRWLAQRAPAWVTSDGLTLLGLLAQIAAGLNFALARTHRLALLAVILCVFLNWLGDSLDGTLARVRCQQRPRYGFYVDHIVDLFGALALMSGLACSGFVHPQVAIAMLVAFLLLAGESFLASYTLQRFELSQGLFGPTEIRILLIIGVLKLLNNPVVTLLGHHMLLFDLGGAIATVIMLSMAVRLTLLHAAELYQQEPLA
jgi:phosphatidylglycerophosphate synthase